MRRSHIVMPRSTTKSLISTSVVHVNVYDIGLKHLGYSIFRKIRNLFSVIRVQDHDMYNVFSDISDLFSNLFSIIRVRVHVVYNSNFFSTLFSIIVVQDCDM